MVLVWKNIRERLQKYDTDMTKAKPLKKKFILDWLAFQQIMLHYALKHYSICVFFGLIPFFLEQFINSQVFISFLADV